METREEMEYELIHFLGDIMKEDRMDISEHISKIIQNIPTIVTPKNSYI